MELIAYTSILRADTATSLLASEHLSTEELLTASGVPHLLLRNSWYFENYTSQISSYLENGQIVGAAGEGPISAAPRAEYAEAAAVALTAPDQEGAVYELGGDQAFTIAELAAELAAKPDRTSPTRTCQSTTTPSSWSRSDYPRLRLAPTQTATGQWRPESCSSRPEISASSSDDRPHRC